MKLGFLGTEEDRVFLSALVRQIDKTIEISHLVGIEDAYYALFSYPKTALTGLIIRNSQYKTKLFQFIECAKLNFPELRVFLMAEESPASEPYMEEKFQWSEAGIRLLIESLDTAPAKGRYPRRANSPLGNLYQKYELMLDHAGEAIIGINRQGRINFANRFACELFECGEQDLIGSHLSDFAMDSPLEEGSSPTSFTGRGRTRRRVGRGVIRSRGDKLTCVEYTLSYVGNAQDDTVSVMVIEDISARVKFETKLKALAHLDPLTGVYNRHYLKRAFAKLQRSRRKEDKKGSLLCIDLDDFKTINDTCGHLAGDQVLKSVAQQLRSHSRRGDLICRYGGDEFVILTEETNVEALETMARNIAVTLMQHSPDLPEPLSVTASIGIAHIEPEDVSLESVIAKADAALYQVKGEGKAHFRIHGAKALSGPNSGNRSMGA